MSIKVRNLEKNSPVRRRDFTFTCVDDAGRTTALADALGDVLIGVPEPDSTKTKNIFVVDQVFLGVAEEGGDAVTDLVELDVFAGAAGTTMLTAVAQVAYVDGAQAVPFLAKVGQTDAGAVQNPVLKAAASCEVAAGTGIYIDLDVVNTSSGTIVPFGAITVIVSGYYKEQHI